MEKIVRRLFLTGTLIVGLAITNLGLQTFAEDEAGVAITNKPTCDNASQTFDSGDDSLVICADDPAEKIEGVTASSTFSVKINKTLTLMNVEGTNIDAVFSQVSTGTIKATVITNSKYNILLSATAPDLKHNVTDSSATIPAITSIGLNTNQNGWGVREGVVLADYEKPSNDDTSKYKGITTTATQFFTGGTGTDGKAQPTGTTGVTTVFPVGVTVAPGLASGSYSTIVTVTAVTAE